MRARDQRVSASGRFTGGCLAVALLLSGCGSQSSHGASGSSGSSGSGGGTATTAGSATAQTASTSSAAATYCQRFTAAVISQAPGFSFAPDLSVYAPGNDPGVGGTIGANLKRLTTGSYTCQWRTSSADIEVGVFLLHSASSESDWQTANAVDSSTATSLSGVGDWAYTQSGTSAVVAGVGTDVLFVDTDEAPEVNGENLASSLIPDLG